MQTSAKIILVVLILLSLAYVGYKSEIAKPIPTPTPTPSPTNTPGPSETPTPTPIPKEEGVVIHPGESVQVQCGEGSDGIWTKWKGQGLGMSWGANTSTGEQVELAPVELLDANSKNARGALVTWRLYDWGNLRINGCNATFTAPDSIGLAYSTSATVSARVELPTPTPRSGTGEGGPIMAGYSTSAKITIYAGGSKPTCHDPAGVAISTNSLPTTSNVQIRVDTPQFLGRVYNGRNFTVRDGPGTYYIQIFVNGALYGQTQSTVAKCQLPPVKF